MPDTNANPMDVAATRQAVREQAAGANAGLETRRAARALHQGHPTVCERLRRMAGESCRSSIPQPDIIGFPRRRRGGRLEIENSAGRLLRSSRRRARRDMGCISEPRGVVDTHARDAAEVLVRGRRRSGLAAVLVVGVSARGRAPQDDGLTSVASE